MLFAQIIIVKTTNFPAGMPVYWIFFVVEKRREFHPGSILAPGVARLARPTICDVLSRGSKAIVV